jgi:hypothetical protein
MIKAGGTAISDLSIEAFIALRKHFFDADGRPNPFLLRPKRNTQDDPFDEYLVNNVFTNIVNVKCAKAPGPLITPDIVLFKKEFDSGILVEDLLDIKNIISIEVKKVERTRQGCVARASGLDYNTTPPCGMVRVYDINGKILKIRSFYLFVCLEYSDNDKNQNVISALALGDGNVLNEDFNFYLSIVGERKKRIDLGSYRDGADRARPMLIFPNPLGAKELDHNISLVHPKENLEDFVSDLRLVHDIERTSTSGEIRHFYCYRCRSDVSANWLTCSLKDPFPTPSREVKTQPRGRFRLPFSVKQ